MKEVFIVFFCDELHHIYKDCDAKGTKSERTNSHSLCMFSRGVLIRIGTSEQRAHFICFHILESAGSLKYSNYSNNSASNTPNLHSFKVFLFCNLEKIIPLSPGIHLFKAAFCELHYK